MVDWYTADEGEPQDRLVKAWRDAPIENTEVCGFILGIARLQVLAYAPESKTVAGALEELLVRFGLVEHLPALLAALGGDSSDPPFNYVYAQLQQAKNLLMAGSVARGGEYGDGEFSYEPRPLDKAIKNLIRPIDGKPHVL